MDSTRIVAIHEAGHAVVAETLGLKVIAVDALPRQDREGTVRYEQIESQLAGKGAVLAAGHAALRLLAPDVEPQGHERDLELLEELAQRHAETYPELWPDSHARAYSLVREEEYLIRAVADEIEAAARHGKGLSSSALGAVIGQAKDEHAASRLLYGQRPRKARHDLTGSTPSEAAYRRKQGAIDLAKELGDRRARLEELGVTVRSTKTHSKTVAPTRRPFTSGFLEGGGREKVR